MPKHGVAIKMKRMKLHTIYVTENCIETEFPRVMHKALSIGLSESKGDNMGVMTTSRSAKIAQKHDLVSEKPRRLNGERTMQVNLSQAMTAVSELDERIETIIMTPAVLHRIDLFQIIATYATSPVNK